MSDDVPPRLSATTDASKTVSCFVVTLPYLTIRNHCCPRKYFSWRTKESPVVCLEIHISIFLASPLSSTPFQGTLGPPSPTSYQSWSVHSSPIVLFLGLSKVTNCLVTISPPIPTMCPVFLDSRPLSFRLCLADLRATQCSRD